MQCKGETMSEDIKEKTMALIDSLKSTCQSYGMGNDGNEYKVITQVFLYKFLNDKFGYEVKKISSKLANADKWEIVYRDMSQIEREKLFDTLSPDVPRLNPEHYKGHTKNEIAQKLKVHRETLREFIKKITL